MELWQMDVVGGIYLADRVELKVVSGIDDNSRFVVSAKVVARATARPVCEALLLALRTHGIQEQILTDIQTWWCPEGLGSSGRQCEDRGVRHPLIVVA
jgi:integral membrane sensor domain MASE1